MSANPNRYAPPGADVAQLQDQGVALGPRGQTVGQVAPGLRITRPDGNAVGADTLIVKA